MIIVRTQRSPDTLGYIFVGTYEFIVCSSYSTDKDLFKNKVKYSVSVVRNNFYPILIER